MVTHISFTVDDELGERAKKVKERKDLSWPEYLKVATEELE